MASTRNRILFQGSYKISGDIRSDTPEQFETALPIAKALGEAIIREGFGLVLTGSMSLDAEVGASAVSACHELGIDPRDRIRTYAYGRDRGSSPGFGMVLEPLDKRWQEVRTFILQESDAVVALLGGKGTSDSIQKAFLAQKPVFPISIAGGAAKQEWERLKRSNYYYRLPGDLDFLADKSMEPEDMAKRIVQYCKVLLFSFSREFSRRIFIVHGHDSELKNEIARTLEKLDFMPVILHEQPDRGRTVISKLKNELSDVGFAVVLLTPDDVGASAKHPDTLLKRARQNVIFEHGLLIGLLGSDRVCAIIKEEVELPSDLAGVLYKRIPAGGSLEAIVVGLLNELSAAGYSFDANKLIKEAT